MTGSEAGVRAPGEPGQGVLGGAVAPPLPWSCSCSTLPYDPEPVGVWVARDGEFLRWEGYQVPVDADLVGEGGEGGRPERPSPLLPAWRAAGDLPCRSRRRFKGDNLPQIGNDYTASSSL